LTDEGYRDSRVAVAERDGEVIGIAMSGPPRDAAATWTRQLHVVAADHDTDAGRALLEAVTDAEESVVLWVADPNPRAQAFYRKHGFVADGTAEVEDGMQEIRMVRDRGPRSGKGSAFEAAHGLGVGHPFGLLLPVVGLSESGEADLG
jgi:predicted GNAT family N-acyltransferase